MIQNLYSLGLLRNGKVYQSKELAIQGLTQVATNDGVAKLARYLDPVVGGDPIIRTIVGFYAKADEMEDAGGGQSSYTILDIDGNASDIKNIEKAIDDINSIIGVGIQDETLTEAIIAANNSIDDLYDTLGTEFTTEHTVADALAEMKTTIENNMAVTIEESGSEEYAKVYTIKQGGVEIGTINIPKDIVIKEGKLVYGLWEGDTFYENTEETHYGDEPAIKLVLNNDQVIYINAKDLVDVYTPGNGISLENNEISIKLDRDGEPFLTVGENGLMLSGVQVAIDNAVEAAKLIASDGINILDNNKIKAVAAINSTVGIVNPISVDNDGIKFASVLDCGYFDYNIVIANSAADIESIDDPSYTNLIVSNEEAIESLTLGKTFNNITIKDGSIDSTIGLSSKNTITVDGLNVSGGRDGNVNGKINYSAPYVEINNVIINEGVTVYNVFEGDQTNANLKSFTAKNVNIDDIALTHNVFNVYKPANDAVIKISDSSFNLDVNNSNILRLANYANATGVTVVFEDVDWTYENAVEGRDFGWAGLIIYQPSNGDISLSGDLSAISTWIFKFKNCRYNGEKVTANNFGEHNQVFYLHKVSGITFQDPVALGLTLNFE